MVIKDCIVKNIFDNCPKCKNFIEARWLSSEEQKKMGFSNWTLVEYYFCASCGWSAPCSFIRDEFKDILPTKEKEKYSRERDLVEKIASSLLPRQDIKIRFVDNQKKVAEAYGYVIRGKDNRCVCFVVEPLIEEERISPGSFCDVIAHELAHASREVFKNPQYNPHSEKFFAGVGHDKIWCDKYNEFQERIKDENLTAGSEYIANGKETKKGGVNDKSVYIRNGMQGNSLITDIFKVVIVIFLVIISFLIIKKVIKHKRGGALKAPSIKQNKRK